MHAKAWMTNGESRRTELARPSDSIGAGASPRMVAGYRRGLFFR
jgi:hypothetical protein